MSLPGRCYVQVGDLSEAVSDFERALGSEELKAGAAIQGISHRQILTEHREAQRKLTASPLSHYEVVDRRLAINLSRARSPFPMPRSPAPSLPPPDSPLPHPPDPSLRPSTSLPLTLLVQVLGLNATNGMTSSISADDIKKAYRKMAIRYHPDKQAHLGREARERMERRFKVTHHTNRESGVSGRKRERKKEREKERQTHRQTHRQTDRHAGRQADKHTDRQTDKRCRMIADFAGPKNSRCEGGQRDRAGVRKGVAWVGSAWEQPDMCVCATGHLRGQLHSF